MFVCCFERQKIQNLPCDHKKFGLIRMLIFEIFRGDVVGRFEIFLLQELRIV